MNANEQKKIFAQNLKRILAEQHLAQIDASDAIGVPPQTFNNWIQGNTLPRMNKLQALADYLGIEIPDLVDPPSDEPRTIEKLLRARPDLDQLLDVARKLSPDDVRTLTDLARRLGGGSDV